MLSYTPTPIQEIFDAALENAGVRLLVKREDLNHPYVSGNKWWKLKYNLQQAKMENRQTILTFGGAYSNHIVAVSAAAKELGFKSIGIIRGEKHTTLNATLAFAEKNNMLLHYVSRDDYRKKTSNKFLEDLHNRFGEFFLIPEGGTNALAVNGCHEFGNVLSEYDFQHLLLPVGTGGTMAGIVSGLPTNKNIIGISVLKGGAFLQAEVTNLMEKAHHSPVATWAINTGYHFGGYAKSTAQLLAFIVDFEKRHHIPVEHCYTGKMFAAIFDLVKRGNFSRGDSILAVHTGGLQGKLMS